MANFSRRATKFNFHNVFETHTFTHPDAKNGIVTTATTDYERTTMIYMNFANRLHINIRNFVVL